MLNRKCNILSLDDRVKVVQRLSKGGVNQVGHPEPERGKDPDADNREREGFCTTGKTGKMVTVSTERNES